MKNISKIFPTIPGEGTGFGYVKYRPGGRFGPRFQHVCQLVVIHQGSLDLLVNGTDTHVLRRGEGIVLCPGDTNDFQFSTTSETSQSWCQIVATNIPCELAIPRSDMNRVASCSPWLQKFLSDAWKLNPSAGAGRQMVTAAVLTCLWEFCGAFAVEPENSRPTPAPLQRALAMMEARMDSPLTLDELVRSAGVSKGHFIKLAKQHWGMTPMEYVWQRRLREAAHLLRVTGLSISEVAYQCGFANPFHFSRKFRAHFGTHPRAWRKAEWNGPPSERNSP